MKIGYLFSRYPVPSQTFCDTEMRALAARGCEIEIYSCSPPTTSFRHDAAGRPRVPVFYAPPKLGLELERRAAVAAGTWPAAQIAEYEARFGAEYEPARRALHAVAFAERLRQRGVEHIHVHFANRATHAALFIRALTGIPFSFTAHAQDFLVDLGNDALLAEMCAQAAFVVTVSDFSQQALLEKCPAAVGKVHRIYNGLPLDRWPAPAPGTEPTGRALRIFSAGRLIDFKGFDDLIAACARLRARGLGFRCEIAGDGPLAAALQRQILALDLGAHMHLTGLLSQAGIRARLADCDVFALAAKVDPQGACDVLPTVILEAMAAGRPVVSTRLAGIPEMVVSGETGLLVEPADPAAFAGALAELAADPLLRERFGQAGRRRFEERFSAESAASRLAELFGPETSPAPCQLAGGDSILLVDSWPLPDVPAAETRIVAFRANTPSAEAQRRVSSVDFLPDAMVLEAEWREHAAEAHRLEAWRSELGAGLETNDFLLAARRALYLHHCWQFAPPVRQVRAIGPAALLCAWLLLRLEPSLRASFILPAADAGRLPKSVLRHIEPAFRTQ